ncbi:MAG: hypothetical protein JNJ73_02125 [Hyphomonadaceae bacterium]|nr:hypothetical protein [Hyphomonadaceae bacterium]
MRKLLFASVAALLAACGQPAQPDGAQQQASAPAVFPNLNAASYRIEATITNPVSGQASNVVQYRSGSNLRMEMPGATVLINGETKEAVNLVTAGGRTVAMRVPLSNFDVGMQMQPEDVAAMALVGPCTGAGEIGSEWGRTNEAGSRSTGCLTADGILLKGTVDGKTTWETTSLARGPQDPALFSVPAGVQVMDLGGLAAKFGKAQ